MNSNTFDFNYIPTSNQKAMIFKKPFRNGQITIKVCDTSGDKKQYASISFYPNLHTQPP